MNHPNQTPHNNRDWSLDFLRGCAVVLMMLAHAIFFFHDESNVALRAVARTGNTLCFVLFLFVSGAALYHGFLQHPQPYRERVRKVLKRTFHLLMGYYLIALAARAAALNFADVARVGSTFVNVLLLIDVPNFVEFLVPFAFYSLSLLVLVPVYRSLSRSWLKTVIVGVAAYALAYALYPLVFASPWREIKALVVGDDGLSRFPVLTYWLVLLLGMWWGQYLQHHVTQKQRNRSALVQGVALAGVAGMGFYLTNLRSIPLLDPFNRWPPSIGFLAVGLAAAFLLYLFFQTISHPRWTDGIYRVLRYMGSDAYDLFIVHLLLLFGYRELWDQRFAEAWIVVLLTAALFALSVGISSLNWKTSPSLLRLAPIGFVRHPRRFKKRYVVAASMLLAVVFWHLNRDYAFPQYGNTIGRTAVWEDQVKPLKAYAPWQWGSEQWPWPSESALWVRQIDVVSAEALTPIEAQAQVALTFDHAALVLTNRSLSSGADLALLYYDGTNFQPVPLALENPSTGAAVMRFELMNRLYPGQKDNRYFLLYTNTESSGDRLLMQDDQATGRRYTVHMGDEQSRPLSLHLNQRWAVAPLPERVTAKPLELSLTINDSELIPAQGTAIAYEIVETGQTGLFSAGTRSVFGATLVTKDLIPGIYHVRAYVPKDGVRVYSAPVEFVVSAPYLVAWTMDWEGWDVEDAKLESIAAQSARHGGVPITHFFNPRIYLPQVMTAERAQTLTDWIIGRARLARDEIQLHLHMHFDLVEAAGVAPRTEPKWGYRSAEGYDVPTTAYSKEEFKQLLDWGKAQFKANGLPVPTGYRAGGWFADETTLAALEESGFSYDASGRERRMWGGTTSSPWNLNPDSQPYTPSVSDQNSAQGKQLTLLEIPNNGGDAYAYAADELVARFGRLYDGTPLASPQVIVYLSHAQWQDSDERKMDTVFETVNQALYEADRGPAVYVTLSEVEELWSR